MESSRLGLEFLAPHAHSHRVMQIRVPHGEEQLSPMCVWVGPGRDIPMDPARIVGESFGSASPEQQQVCHASP